MTEAKSELKNYLLNALPAHLASANKKARLADLLTNYHFIQKKISFLGPQALIEDYAYSTEDDLLLVRDALMLFSHLIQTTPNSSIASQLYGRLFQYQTPYVQNLLAQLDDSSVAWLKPITNSLTPPRNMLIRTIASDTDAVVSLAVTSGGESLIASYRDRQVKIFDLSQGSELEDIFLDASVITAIAICEPIIIFGDEHGFLTLWDMKRRTVIDRIEAHDEALIKLHVISNSNQMVSCSRNQIQIWDLSSKAEQVRIIQQPNIKAMACDDAGQIITGHENGEINVWKLDDGEKLSSWPGSSLAINDIKTIKNRNQLLAIDAGFAIYLWDYKGAQIWNLPGVKSNIEIDSCQLAINVEREVAVSSFGSRNNRLRLVDLKVGEELNVFDAHGWPITSLLFSSDGREVISGSQDARVKIWDLTKDYFGREKVQKHSDDVSSVIISPDQKKGVSCSLDGTIMIWDLETGESHDAFSELGSYLYGIQMTRDGKFLIGGGYPGSISIWDSSTNEKVGALKRSLGSETGFVLSSDNSHIISVGKETLTIWPFDGNKDPKHYAFPGTILANLAVNDSGELIYIATHHNEIIVFDLLQENIKTFLVGHTKAINKLLPLHKTLISASEDGSIVIWNISTGQMEQSLIGHKGAVKDIALLPSETELISASSDGSLRVWDIISGETIQVLEGHNSIVWRLCVSNDGKRAASISGDESLILWEIEKGKMIAQFSLENRPSCLAADRSLNRIIIGEMGGRIHIIRVVQ